MNAYVASVIDYVKQAHGNEPEFVQTVEEVLSSVSPIMDARSRTRTAKKPARM